MDWSLLGFRGLGQVFNIHPVFVHFPIALFPTVLFFYCLGVVRKNAYFLFAGRCLLYLAFISTAITVITGELAEDTFPHNETIHTIMMTHEKIGFAVLILGFVLSCWSFFKTNGFPKAKWLFLFVLAFTLLMVLQNGDLGGRMVFVEGAAVKKAAPLMKPTDSNTDGDHEEEEHHHHHPH